ncbi:MAG TPA: hypothetical protein VFY18_01050 [Candidatus Limnocylindrales bacterium]|nr:hypothetical protein [Candidatus Limnocylindrales bacterium]
MPFPFLPGGALLAIAVLGGALTIFGLVLRAMDKAITAGRRTMLSGLVAGFRTWTGSAGSAAEVAPLPPLAFPAFPASPAPSTMPVAEIVEVADRRLPDDRPVA